MQVSSSYFLPSFFAFIFCLHFWLQNFGFAFLCRNTAWGGIYFQLLSLSFHLEVVMVSVAI